MGVIIWKLSEESVFKRKEWLVGKNVMRGLVKRDYGFIIVIG